MYIEASYYKTVPERSHVEPRERYKRYYRDLHDRYKIQLNELTLLEGSQSKYHELAYPIFDALAHDERLENIDTLVVAQWVSDFDADYVSLGAHLAHRYNFSCHMFDVLDQGSICGLTALSLLKKSKSNKALCLALDQTTVLRSDLYSYPIPMKPSSAALYLSTETSKMNAIKLLDIEVWPEKVLCDSKLDVIAMIITTLDKHNIDIYQCVLNCKRNSIFYRAINLYRHQYKKLHKQIEFNFLPLNLGCTELFYHIHQLVIANNFSKKYYVYLDEDVESLTSGLVILQVPYLCGVNGNANFSSI